MTARISLSEGGRGTIIAVSNNTVSFFFFFQVRAGLANVERTAVQCRARTGVENRSICLYPVVQGQKRPAKRLSAVKNMVRQRRRRLIGNKIAFLLLSFGRVPSPRPSFSFSVSPGHRNFVGRHGEFCVCKIIASSYIGEIGAIHQI